MAETVGLVLLAGLTVETAAGTAAVAALTIGGTSLTVATVVGSAALLGASIAIAYATQPGVPKPSDAGGTQNIKQATPPRPFGYGRCRLAGAFVCYEQAAPYSFDVLALHQGRIAGPVLYFLHDDLVEIDGSGFVVTVFGVSDNRYDIDDTPDVMIQSRLGLDTETAYAEVIAGLPAIWTADHRGDGVASLMLRCVQPGNVQNFSERYPRGLPRLSVVADLSPVFDPRDEAQDREDPDTWQLSTNPVLQLLDYLTNEDRGPGLDWDVLVEPVIDALMAQADICDEAVAKADGTSEPRYSSNGWAMLSTDPADVIAAMLATCDGWMAEAGDGTLALKVGKYSAPTVTLTDDHIIGYEIAHGVADEDVVNELQISFVAPGNDYREAPGIAWRDTASVAELGRVRSNTLQLNWVQSHSQARRLAKRAMARNLASRRGQLVTSLYGLQALGHRWLAVQSEQTDDLANVAIEVTRARVDIQNATVTFDWVLVNANEIDAWDEDTEEGTAPTFDSKLTPLPEGMALAAAGSTIEVTIGNPGRDAGDTALTYAVEYRLSGSLGAWTREVFTSATWTDLGNTLEMTTAALAAGTWDVRVASIGAGANGALSPWTTTDDVTI